MAKNKFVKPKANIGAYIDYEVYIYLKKNNINIAGTISEYLERVASVLAGKETKEVLKKVNIKKNRNSVIPEI